MQRRPRRKEGFARGDGDGSRGHVDETKAAADEFAEVDAVAKGGDDRGLGEGVGDGGDAESGAKKRDEALDHDPLGPKTTKQLVARQPRRGVTETGGRRRAGEEGEPDRERRRGADEQEAWIFF